MGATTARLCSMSVSLLASSFVGLAGTADDVKLVRAQFEKGELEQALTVLRRQAWVTAGEDA
jgi:hypothetical protein